MAGRLKLKRAVIHPYHSIEQNLNIDLSNPMTAFIGKNEVGKTSILEALGKANYYLENCGFAYQPDDYPRRMLAQWKEDGSLPAVELELEADEELLEEINQDMGILPRENKLVRTTCYSGKKKLELNGFFYDMHDFWELKAETYPELKPYRGQFSSLHNEQDWIHMRHQILRMGDKAGAQALEHIKKYVENPNNWMNPINEYVYRTYIWPELPQFIYYDEWNILPASIDLGRLVQEKEQNDNDRMAQALLTLIGLDAKTLLEMPEGSELDTLLELASADLTKKFLSVWHNNEKLRLELTVVHKPPIKAPRTSYNPFQRPPVYPQGELNIRIRDIDAMVTLPLDKRSRGFQWYFSFWVWFTAVQKTSNIPYILLLDEPGLHLHTEAKLELLCLLTEISRKTPVIYSTHSGTMSNPQAACVYLVKKETGGTSAERLHS